MFTHVLRRAAATLAAAFIATLIAACGGGGGGGAPPAPTGNVGPSGATVTSTDNQASLVVPAGALSTPINVALSSATSGYIADPQLAPGTVYKIDAPDTILAHPAELSITVPEPVAPQKSQPRAYAGGGPVPSTISLTIACNADASSCWFADAAGRGCSPPQGTYTNGNIVEYPVLLGYDSNFSSPDSLYAPGHPYNGPASYCAKSTPPTPQIVSLGGGLVVLPTLFNPSTHIATSLLGSIRPSYFGALLDNVAPTVKITATIVPGASNTATLKLSALASDNIAVTKVTFEKVTGIQLVPTFQITKSPIAQFVTSPYEWQSGPLAISDIYGKAYLACAFDAANNKRCDFVAPQLGAPVLTNFAATPAALSNAGGLVTLSWTASDASTLSIDHGVGNVSGQVSASATVSTTTTFTLTATNAIGTTTATTTVTVQPPAAPTISSFTATPASLAAAGDPVTLNWATTGATSVAIDNGIGVVTGTSKVVNVTASTTFTLTASNAGGSTTAQANVVVAASGDRFVDPTAGLDTNSCTQAAPCMTIAKAVTGAPAGSVVYLGDGNYPSSNSATIPDGVALRAIHLGAATLNFVSLTAAGSTSVNGLVFDAQGQSCSNLTATTSTGTPTLAITGVLFKCTGALNLGGSVKAVMTPALLANGRYTVLANAFGGPLVNLSGTAELLIQGGIIDFSNFGQGSYGPGMLSTVGSSKLTLDAVTVRNLKQQAFVITGSAGVTLRNGTVIDRVGDAGDCGAGAAIVVAEHGTLTMDHATVSNGPNAAICVTGSTAPLPTIQLTQSTISGMAGSAISTTTGTSADAQLTADGLALINNGRAITWTGTSAAASITLSNMTITGNTAGGMTLSNGTIKLRGSTVTGNGAEGGVSLYGSPSVDLGTPASPGGNTIKGNSGAQINSFVAPGQTVDAVGNIWTPSVQGADANGRYSLPPAFAPVPKTGPTTGANYQIYSASTLNL